MKVRREEWFLTLDEYTSPTHTRRQISTSSDEFSILVGILGYALSCIICDVERQRGNAMQHNRDNCNVHQFISVNAIALGLEATSCALNISK
jgi:hypothetical protein